MAQRVDFYVLPGEDPRARLRLACRIAEKAFLAGQQVFVWSNDAAELASFDELLWTFTDRSFVPHEPFQDAQQWQDTAVLLGTEQAPQQPFDVLLNLGSTVPAAAAHAARIAEVIDAEPTRRQHGRQRFRHYRDQGLTPETHNIAADQLP